MKLKCVIFDFDGTLFDSMYLWDTVAESYVRSRGKEPKPTVREEVRAARTEDVRALAPSVDAIAGAGCVCAFGNGEVIRASGEDFNVVDLLA